MKNKDIELKYKINAYRLSKEYPTEKDILFDIFRYIMSKNKRKKKWGINDFILESSELEQAIPAFSDENKKEQIKKLLYNIFEQVYFKYEGSKMTFTKQALELFYKI